MRGTFAHQVGQEHDAFGAGRDFSRLFFEQLVRVNLQLGSTLNLGVAGLDAIVTLPL